MNIVSNLRNFCEFIKIPVHDRPENTGYVVQLVCVLVYLLKDVASMATLLIQRYFETDQLRADQLNSTILTIVDWRTRCSNVNHQVE